MMGYVDKLIEELELQVKKTSEEAIKTIEKTLRNRNKAVNEFIILAHKKNKQLKEDMEHASEYSRIEILAERQDLIDGIEEATKIITEKPEIE
jgi:ribosomal protein L30E